MALHQKSRKSLCLLFGRRNSSSREKTLIYMGNKAERPPAPILIGRLGSSSFGAQTMLVIKAVMSEPHSCLDDVLATLVVAAKVHRIKKHGTEDQKSQLSYEEMKSGKNAIHLCVNFILTIIFIQRLRHTSISERRITNHVLLRGTSLKRLKSWGCWEFP